ncbi:MAG TPA: glucokinase [Sphingomicrobium sp.]|nr:glucokinase [Sphingomicrobium sp.]
MSSEEIAVADIGGTHARFALAEVDSAGVVALSKPVVLRTADYAGLQGAWTEFARVAGRPLPSALAMAFAGPVAGETLKLTNSGWVIDRASLAKELGVDRAVIVNDFGAVAHAVAGLGEDSFLHVCGPPEPLPGDGVISVIGPGTGLGVAELVRRSGSYEVIETEGGHVDFAPLDETEDRILQLLRREFGRVSIERLLAGNGLDNVHWALATIDGRAAEHHDDDRALWAQALDGSDSAAVAALDRFCLILGAVAGDFALAHGASAVVIGGGLGLKLADILPRSGFKARFVAKGRFERRMAAMPVKLITYPQPGLYGAAAAFAREASASAAARALAQAH